jgi:DivIVA domain-containing protein
MNGNDVRGLAFPRRSGGYDPAAVDELLRAAAAELDASRPVASLAADAAFPRAKKTSWRGTSDGYDTDAVDWVLGRLRRQDDPDDQADPWRDLPVLKAEVRSLPQYSRECADAWRDFPAQRGTRLSLIRAGGRNSELRSEDQQPLVARHGSTSFTMRQQSRTFRLRSVKSADRLAFAEAMGVPPVGPAHLLRSPEEARSRARLTTLTYLGLRMLADENGLPVLYTAGTHQDGLPLAFVMFPSRRWMRFPVRGTGRSDAIMTAVDQDGGQVARYRIARSGVLHGWNSIEVIIHPDRRLTDELALAVAVTAPWISSFFQSSGGGG